MESGARERRRLTHLRAHTHIDRFTRTCIYMHIYTYKDIYKHLYHIHIANLAHADTLRHDNLAERSKAVAQGAIP